MRKTKDSSLQARVFCFAYVLSRYIRKELTRQEASRILHLSQARISRLKKKVLKEGPSCLIHGNRGKGGHHKIPDEERRDIVDLLLKQYADFKPTFACEKLRDIHNIDRDPKTIRGIMMEEGLWKPRRGLKRGEHRAWRQRRACEGELVQFDGSYHDWFEGRGRREKICLLAAIDDATGKILKATFAPDEGVESVFSFWRGYVQALGRPWAIYLDKFSTYKMNAAFARDNHDLKTQFGRAMEEMAVEVIFAHSPQAKGRVERLFETLQDRLIKELRLAGISTIEEANRFLNDVFIPAFNRRFGVEARNTTNLHRPLTSKQMGKLDSVFSRQEKRTVQNDFTLSYKSQWYQLTKQHTVTVCRRDAVTVEERLDGTVHIRLRGKDLNYVILPVRPKRPAKIIPWVLEASSKQPGAVQSLKKPAVDHPWRRAIVASCASKQVTF